MAVYRADRDWSFYNAGLVGRGNVTLFLHHDVLVQWNRGHGGGPRRRGGQRIYPDAVIEACLLLAQLFRLPLRQCQGFVQSFLDVLETGLKAPHYTTLCRRAARLDVQLLSHLRDVEDKSAVVLAIDSTGLKVHASADWYHHKHRAQGPKWHDKWRKLHIGIDTASGRILMGKLTSARTNDAQEGPGMVLGCHRPVKAVVADKAYDTVTMRSACAARGARQLIPPRCNARVSDENHHMRHQRACGQGGTVNIGPWKRQVRYHVRSLVETTMSQLKRISAHNLTSRTMHNRQTEALLRCKLLNILTQP